MQFLQKFVYVFLSVILLLIVSPIEASAVEPDKGEEAYYFQTSLMTRHWSNNDDKNNKQRLLSLEYYPSDTRFRGISYFQNSFDQSCWFVYWGRSFGIWEGTEVRVRGKVSMGIMHGYDEEDGRYNGWLNKAGTFPAFLPRLKLEYKKKAIELVPFASAGIMLTVGRRF